MRISFIIPAYNASKTIFRCLDSIYSLRLTEDEFEVIVIDDCSTDNTREIVNDCQKSHENLFLYCQSQNHRQGAARNIGITKAKGSYIAFVDSDDEIAGGSISALNMAMERKLDMVAYRVLMVSEEGSVEGEKRLKYDRIAEFSGVELQTDFPYWFTGPVAYLYNSTFMRQVAYPFEEDVYYEDCDFVNKHLFYAKKMAYCDEYGYIVHNNPNSTTHTVSFQSLCDHALLGTRMLTFYEFIPDKTTKYAESILEGGSFNIMKSFRHIFRLKSAAEIRAFYDRFDSRYDRKRLRGYKKPEYCWTIWTLFCVKHRMMAIFVVSIAIPLYKVFVKSD